MEISKEVIEANKFTDEQVTAINEFGVNYTAEIKHQYDEEYKATANTNAQKIIGSAASGVEKFTGFRPRENGEHLEVYNQAAFEHFSKEKIDGLSKAKIDYDEKIKNFKGSEDVQKSLNDLRGKFDTLQAKEASFDELLNSGVKEKYDSLLSENETTKIDSAFTSVMPTFPKDVNDYEKVGKWSEFQKGVLQDNNIVKVEKEYFAVDKTNPHKQMKLSDLVAKDSNIQDMLKGRQQEGLGLKPEALLTVEGIPFEVPKGADSKVRATLIKEHLAKENIAITDPNYSAKFSELNSKLLKVA